ncbi:MAG TPA: hypothetical protein HA257_02960 [Candidatus Methanoperedenaceae archaeon]|nr:hypothetical protein [Candidatus Methanoperedenaceae archaeon]
MLLLFPAAASAQMVSITNMYSDPFSADVSMYSAGQVDSAVLVMEVAHGGEVIESRTVPITNFSGELTKVIIWEKKPEFERYAANASLYIDGVLIDCKSYPFSHGTAALPRVHLTDLDPDSAGVLMLFRSYTGALADVTVELINGTDIAYSQSSYGLDIVSPKTLRLNWPILLEKRNYTVRIRLSVQNLRDAPIVTTYVKSFTADTDVEIVRSDAEVDEVGASVTLRGKSQVPFDGKVVVKLGGSVEREFSAPSDILTIGKEDTVGISWDIPPGTYTAAILAVDSEGAVKDRFETMFRTSSPQAVPTATQKVPGADTIAAFFAVAAAAIMAARKIKGG